MKTAVVIGAGGHAKALIETLRTDASVRIAAVLDADPKRRGTDFMGLEILGGDDLLEELAAQGADSFVVGLGSIGNTTVRRKVWDRAEAAGLEPLAVISPAAWVSQSAEIGPGCQILPGVVVMPDCRLGRGVIVNTGAQADHDCTIGDFCHLAPGAVLSGNVTVGADAHLGVGCRVLQGMVIGSHALVGAGAVVVQDVNPRTVVMGVPAREKPPKEPRT
ncbi:MAG: acetyltransferase [Fimbriimonadaceae bacterium]|nr:acetyltransferase [Fimbriimonadaceae bacterium]